MTIPDFDTTDTPMRRVRRRLGWSQKRAADTARVHQATWSRVERGAQVPSVDVVFKICAALDLTADQVLEPWRPRAGTDAA